MSKYDNCKFITLITPDSLFGTYSVRQFFLVEESDNCDERFIYRIPIKGLYVKIPPKKLSDDDHINDDEWRIMITKPKEGYKYYSKDDIINEIEYSIDHEDDM